MDNPVETTVTQSHEQGILFCFGVSDAYHAPVTISAALVGAGVTIDASVVREAQFQVDGEDLLVDLTYVFPSSQTEIAGKVLSNLDYSEVDIRGASTSPSTVVTVSVTGVESNTLAGFMAKVCETLDGLEIDPWLIFTSPLRVSCVIDKDQVASAVAALRIAFELSGDEVHQTV